MCLFKDVSNINCDKGQHDLLDNFTNSSQNQRISQSFETKFMNKYLVFISYLEQSSVFVSGINVTESSHFDLNRLFIL